MIWRAVAAATVAAGAIVALASPAAAHGGQGADRPAASNYRTTITSVSPPMAGIEVRVLEAGSRMELRNTTDADAIVLGYQGEPYLRVGPRGVYENVRSPAAYLNADRQGRTQIPPAADPAAGPQWRQLNDGTVARWHDHRAHWMGDDDPPAVDADRSRPHLVIEGWVIPVQVGGVALEVTGDLTWVPAPSRWPWLAGSLAIGAITFLGVRRRPWPLLAASSLVLLVASAVEARGVWLASVDSSFVKAAELAVPAAAGVLLLIGLATYRRTPRDSLLLIGGAATGLALLFGIADLSWLGASQLPTAVPPIMARLAIATSLGVGGALLATAVVTARATTSPTPAARPSDPPGYSPLQRLDPASSRRHRRVLVGGLVALGLVAAFATAPDRDEPAASRPQDLHRDVCAVLHAAQFSGAATATDFATLLHEPLHELVRTTEALDRPASERLLEAERRVEAVIASNPAQVSPALIRLERTVREAIGRPGSSTTSCENYRS